MPETTPHTNGAHLPAPAVEPRIYHRWAIYRFAGSWRALDPSARDIALAELRTALETPVAEWQLCYSLLGLRADADFAIWLKTDYGTEPLQQFERHLQATAAGPHLDLAHNFL